MESPLAPMLLPLWMSFFFMVFAGMQLVALRVESAASRSSSKIIESTTTGSWHRQKYYSPDSSASAILAVTLVTVATAIGSTIVTMMVLNFRF